MKAIIIGGGVAGCSAAIFLTKIGFKVTVYEKYPSPAIHVGGGLGLGSNGLSTLALYSQELADRIYERGHRAPVWEMRDWDGSVLGAFPAGREGWGGRRYGTCFLRRWDVHEILLEEAGRLRVEVVYGMEVVKVEEGEDEGKGKGCARVWFKDGRVEEADIVVGADGARSKVREFVAPEAKVVYTGYMGVGGFVRKDEVDFDPTHFDGILHTPPSDSEDAPRKSKEEEIGAIMTFGPLGFFGFGPSDRKSKEDGGCYGWWSNYEAQELRDTIVDPAFATDTEVVVKELWERHGDWHTPIPSIIQIAKQNKIITLPEYILSNTDRTHWHTKRVVLIGDAAHIFQPHTGQGVSQTLEDVACLTRVLRELAGRRGGGGEGGGITGEEIKAEELEKAFRTFEERRRPRVEKIIAIGRKVGQDKHRRGAIACFFRKWFMILFIKFFAREKMLDEVMRCQFTRKEVFGSGDEGA